MTAATSFADLASTRATTKRHSGIVQKVRVRGDSSWREQPELPAVDMNPMGATPTTPPRHSRATLQETPRKAALPNACAPVLVEVSVGEAHDANISPRSLPSPPESCDGRGGDSTDTCSQGENAEEKRLACLEPIAMEQALHIGDQIEEIVVEQTLSPVKCEASMQTPASTTASAAQGMIASVSDKAINFSTRASEVNTAVKDIASDPKAKSTAIGAAGGAVAMGTTGGAMGLVSGSMAGAVVGLPLAIFTFGLSIPIGASLGGGAGLCVGTAVGGTTGLVAGGAAGYKKDSIVMGTRNALAQAGDCAQYAKEKASSSLFSWLTQADSMRALSGRVAGQ